MIPLSNTASLPINLPKVNFHVTESLQRFSHGEAKTAPRSKLISLFRALTPHHHSLSADAAAKLALFTPYLQAERAPVITGSDTPEKACSKSPLPWLAALSLTILQFRDSAPCEIESYSIRQSQRSTSLTGQQFSCFDS